MAHGPARSEGPATLGSDQRARAGGASSAAILLDGGANVGGISRQKARVIVQPDPGPRASAMAAAMALRK